MPADPDDFAELVLELVERIPPGSVMSYGDIADYLAQGGPRQVGRVMSAQGGGVPWWRVIRADGSPPPGHERRALERYAAEGTPLRPDGTRVDMRSARWNGSSQGSC
ncbi:MAG: Methylated-DNA-(protein)-cysteine S-methyltransferase binding protein [Streptosporangiaceae bacterium]|jgi:alkylated DNA nucleotide flippase Atl1|nr:Methylated-DNA-(protein)-cysteine S-methyltransferase binding protein [Streptosporangiaceae bacterium]